MYLHPFFLQRDPIAWAAFGLDLTRLGTVGSRNVKAYWERFVQVASTLLYCQAHWSIISTGHRQLHEWFQTLGVAPEPDCRLVAFLDTASMKNYFAQTQDVYRTSFMFSRLRKTNCNTFVAHSTKRFKLAPTGHLHYQY